MGRYVLDDSLPLVSAALCVTGYGFVVNMVYVGPWSVLGFSMVVGSFFILVSWR